MHLITLLMPVEIVVVSYFSFMILVIYVLSLINQVEKELIDFVELSKNQISMY